MNVICDYEYGFEIYLNEKKGKERKEMSFSIFLYFFFVKQRESLIKWTWTKKYVGSHNNQPYIW